MSMYTTGEIARLCGVSVRTVQYYDSRSILPPSQLSEGGRRLYSEADLQQMKVICFLRELDLPISTIGKLLKEEHPEDVIELLLQEQKKTLQAEIDQREQQMEKLRGLQREMKNLENFSLQSIGDAAHVMGNKKKLKKIRTILLATAIPMGILEWGTIFLWIFTGIWWPFAVYTAVAVPYTVWLFLYYWKHISYICPRCHHVFKPGKREMFFAAHTPTTRRLTCTCCGHRGYCVETCGEPEAKSEHKG